MKKIKLLIITEDVELFRPLEAALVSETMLGVVITESTGQVRRAVENNEVEALIVDEQLEAMSGLDFVNELVRINPLVNCALVSMLQPDEFHEATEGLGVFMQLNGRPVAQEAVRVAARISDHLNKIYGLISS